MGVICMWSIIIMALVSFWTSCLFGWKIAVVCLGVLHFLNVLNVLTDGINLVICAIGVLIGSSIPKSR